MSLRLAFACNLLFGLACAGSPASAQQTSPDAAPPAASGNAPAAPAQPAPPPAPATPASPSPPAVSGPPSNPPAAAEQGMPATVLSPEESEGIIGKSVRSGSGEDMGRIVDIIVTTGTQPRAAVIDFGGFLGVGSRKIAVDWRLLQYSRNGKTWAVTVGLARNQLRVSPEYKPGEPVVVLGMPAVPTPVAAAPAAPPAPPPPPVQAPAPPPAGDPPAVAQPAPDAGDPAKPPQ